MSKIDMIWILEGARLVAALACAVLLVALLALVFHP